jgi:hypothetical protein
MGFEIRERIFRGVQLVTGGRGGFPLFFAKRIVLCFDY